MSSRSSAATLGTFVAERGRHMGLLAGETLFLEGDASSNVYACVSGRIRIAIALPSGRELLVGFRGPGDGFGELSAIDRGPRDASAVAAEDSVVAVLPGDRFLEELEYAPEIALAVLRELTGQMRAANARLRARNSEDTLSRTGHLLLRLAALQRRNDAALGDATDDEVLIELTQHEIAELIGTTRESAARALARLRAAGLVETGRGCVAVGDAGRLASFVEAL